LPASGSRSQGHFAFTANDVRRCQRLSFTTWRDSKIADWLPSDYLTRNLPQQCGAYKGGKGPHTGKGQRAGPASRQWYPHGRPSRQRAVYQYLRHQAGVKPPYQLDRYAAAEAAIAFIG
jgi:hypothetical protein